MQQSIDVGGRVRQLMEEIAFCRDPRCPVPRAHPIYYVPYEPEQRLNGRVGCMPVVPTRLHRQEIMLLGFYPTARFAQVKKQGGEEIVGSVAVEDIDEPFENARYFDRRYVSDVHSGRVLTRDYFEQLELDRNRLWITNMIKCFLFKVNHVNVYHSLNFNTPATFGVTRDRVFEAARPCIQRWLSRELELCRPKLILVMGSEITRMVYSDSETFEEAEFDASWRQVRGKAVRATTLNDTDDKRNKIFKDKNMFFFYHPAYIDKAPSARSTHLTRHIPRARNFMRELNLL